MRNGCNQQYLHHHHNLQKSTFLPMLCSKPSIKDVVMIPKHDDRSPSPAASFSDDPLSPRVGCMGQVKRKNHRVSIFPTNTSSHNFNISTTKFNNNCDNNNNNNIRYFKLKKLFSSKNLITPTTTTTAIATAITTTTSTSGGSSSCCSRRQMMMMNMNMNMNMNTDGSDENYARIDVADLDPPLPVVKKVQNRAEESSSIGSGDEENLWNRRRKRSSALKTLQIQQIHIPIPNQFLQPASI